MRFLFPPTDAAEDADRLTLGPFMARAIAHTHYPYEIIFAALYLLFQAKSIRPQLIAGTGHLFFLTAFRVASKVTRVMRGHTYSTGKWRKIAQKRCTERQLEQAGDGFERIFGEKVVIDRGELRVFKKRLVEIFASPGVDRTLLSAYSPSGTVEIGTGSSGDIAQIPPVGLVQESPSALRVAPPPAPTTNEPQEATGGSPSTVQAVQSGWINTSPSDYA